MPVCLGGSIFERSWLEIDIRRVGDPSFTTLQPRVELTPAAFAVHGVHSASADKLTLPYRAEGTTTGPLLEVVQHGNAPALEVAGDLQLVDGDLRIDAGDIIVIGQIMRSYGGPVIDPIGPVAYGYIGAGGTVLSATSNVTCMWNPSALRYEITIAGESYAAPNYVVTATAIDAAVPQMITNQGSGGKLLIYCWDLTGARVQTDFQFIVYKPTN
jgi:hypothetical protein